MESKWALLFHTFFMLQRLWLSGVIVFFTQYPLFQVHSVFWSQLLMLVYVVSVRPHQNGTSNKLQVFNESCLLLVAILLFPFYYLDEYSSEKFWIGWLFIGLMLLNVLVNISVAVWLAVRKCRGDRKQKKKAKEPETGGEGRREKKETEEDEEK